MEHPGEAQPEREAAGALGKKSKLFVGAGCALFGLLALGALAMFAWMIMQVASLPDYVNRESVEAHYQEDLAKVDQAIAGNTLHRAGNLGLSDAVLAIYSQKVRVKKKTTGNTSGYRETRDASGRKTLYQAHEVTPQGKVTRNGIGYGSVVLDGQEVSCVIVVRKPGAARKGGVKVLGVNVGGRKRDYTEYLVYLQDTFKAN